MKPGPKLVLALALAGLACGGGAPSGAPAVADAGREEDTAAPDVRDAPRAAPAEVGAQADAPSPDGTAADAGLLSPAEVAYRQFVEAYNFRYRQRLVGCFNLNASTLGHTTYVEAEPQIMTSLRL